MKNNKDITQSPIYKALTDPYRRPPKDFPEKIGVLVYNEDFDFLNKEYPNIFSTAFGKAGMKSVKKPPERENWFPVFKEMTDRAMRRERPTQEDKKFLKWGFESGLIVREEKENNCWSPIVSPIKWWGGEDPFKLLFQWINYVWRGTIKIKRCAARECNKIFIPNAGGPEQKYCSVNCRTKAFHQRKRATLTEKT